MGRPTKYPFDELKTGQWFTVPAADMPDIKSLSMYASKKGSEAGKRFAVEVQPNGDVRVRRVEPRRGPKYAIEG